jgi:hypothetical protein
MSYTPPNPNGQATMANSAPVVISSDQSPVSISSTALANIDADLGAQADAAATTDTGTFSLIAFVKRGLQNWTTLLSRIPSLGQSTMANSRPVTIASDQSDISIVEKALIITGQAAQTAVVNNIIPATSGAAANDVGNYRSMSIQVVSTGTGGTFIFEQSNDNTNFVAVPIFNAALVTGVPITAAITATSSQIIYTIPLRCRYIRLRIATTITGGSIQAFSKISTEPWTASAQLVASNTAANLLMSATQSGTWTTQIGNTANTTPILANRLIPVGGTTGDTGAKTATGNGATQTNTTAKGALIVVNLGTVTGTTPTGVFKIQGSADAGTTWLDLPLATTASLTATGVYGIQIYPALTPTAGTATSGSVAIVNSVLPRTWRVVWTLGGTTPSYTITNIQVNYLL